MKFIFSLCLLFMFSMDAIGQPTFNTIYDHDQGIDVSYFSVDDTLNDRYFTTTKARTGNVDSLILVQSDYEGNIQHIYTYSDSGFYWLPENILLLRDTLLVLTGTVYNPSTTDYNPFVGWFSIPGKKFSIRYYPFGFGIEGAKKIRLSHDNGFFVAALTQTFSNRDAQHYFLKIDSTGQKEWELIHGDTTRNEEPYDVVQLQDSSFLVLSRRVYPDNDNILLLRISPNGTLLWEKEVFSPYPRIGASLIPSSDTSFLVAGIAETSDPRGFPFIECFDTNGTSKWFKFYESVQGQLWHGQKLNDTAFVFAGAVNRGNGNGGIQGYLIKVNREGKLIWKRTISPYGQADDPSNDYFYGVLATSDGGLLCTGFTGQGPVSNTQDAWIMKLDSTGLCDTATCFPWLVSVVLPPAQEPLHVWPNPASQTLFLHAKEQGQLILTNVSGAQVLSTSVGVGTLTIDISTLPAGYYVGTLLQQDGQRKHTSIIITR